MVWLSFGHIASFMRIESHCSLQDFGIQQDTSSAGLKIAMLAIVIELVVIEVPLATLVASTLSSSHRITSLPCHHVSLSTKRL